MTMLQLRYAQETGEPDEYSVDGVVLGAAGDEGNSAVLLAQMKLDATVGADAFEVTPGGDFVATVGGRNYVVGLALVRKEHGTLDDSLVFIGVPTEYTPGDSEAAADALAEDKAERRAAKAEDAADRPSRRK
jgi:hypothetical protein